MAIKVRVLARRDWLHMGGHPRPCKLLTRVSCTKVVRTQARDTLQRRQRIRMPIRIACITQGGTPFPLCLPPSPAHPQLRPFAVSLVQNPNVVGSGFISFPPQQRFEKPLLVQPPTISVRPASFARDAISCHAWDPLCIWTQYSLWAWQHPSSFPTS